MKLLITGGEGYIGSNFVDMFYDDHDIYICDMALNCCASMSPAIDDIEEERYDGIIHLAALSGIVACEENYMRAIVDNLLTANNVFSKAARANIPVVFTSSQAAKNPSANKYANLKNQCEMLAELYGGVYVIRLSNVYGGKDYIEKKQTVVKQFITQYNDGKPMQVHGNGDQLRDFVHVHDVCRAIEAILKIKPEDMSPMDIGTGNGTSIMDIINMFPRKQNHHYKFTDSRSAGEESAVADPSEAKRRLGWTAQEDLETYIRSMI